MREQIDVYNKAHPDARINKQSLRESPELMRKVADRFDYVITRTQVYDSVLSRSTHMRSKNGLVKMATAFMAEPTTVANMITVAAANKSRGQKGMGRVVGSVVASTVLNAALAALVYAMRDDDEEKAYAEKYAEQFAGGLKDSFNPLTYFPIARDIVSIFQGYDIERSDMAVISDFYNTVKRLYDDIADEEKGVRFDTVMNFLTNTGSLFGLPTRNIYRDARGIWTTAASAFSGERTTVSGMKYALAEGALGREVSNGRQMYDALMSKDTKHYDRVVARFDTKEKAMSALKAALRDSDGRIAKAAEAKLAGDTKTYNSLISEISDEGNFKKMFVISAVTAEINEMKRDIEQSGEGIFIKDSQSGEDVLYEIDGKAWAQIEELCAEYDEEIQSMKSSAAYRRLTDGQKDAAEYYADGLVEDAVYSKVLGVQIDKASTLTNVVGIGNMAIFYAATRDIESDVDRNGEVISGSKRQKVLRAINALKLPPALKLLLLCAKGYSIKDGDIPGVSAAVAKGALMKYILKLKISKSEKEYLLTMCGFAVQNGKIITKKS